MESPASVAVGGKIGEAEAPVVTPVKTEAGEEEGEDTTGLPVCTAERSDQDAEKPLQAVEGEVASLSPEEASSSRASQSLESISNLLSCPSSELLNDGPGPEDSTRERYPGQSVYHIKWIRWKEQSSPIVTQNENGPCPLLAIMNVLLLAWKVKLPPMMEIITAEQLMEYLGDYILEAKPKEIPEAQRLNYEQDDNIET